MIPQKFLIFFLLIGIWTSLPTQGLEIYVDSDQKSPTTTPTGETNDPFKDLTQAWNKIQEFLASDEIHNEELVIYLKASKIGYAHPEGVNISNKHGEKKIDSLTIKSWDDVSLALNDFTLDCSNLPKLEASDKPWKFANIPNVTLRGLSFTSERKIWINDANDTTVSDVCLSSASKGVMQANTAIILSNIQRPVFKSLMLDLNGYVNLVNLTNEDPMSLSTRVKVKDIAVFVSSVSTYSVFWGSCFEFRIRDYETPKFLSKPRLMNWKSSQELSVKNVNLKFVRKDGNSRYLPLLGTFTGFDSVTIDSFAIEGQYFYMERMTPFKIFDTVTVNITRTLFNNNFFVTEAKGIPAAARFSLYTVGNAQNVSISNISVFENQYILQKTYINVQPPYFQLAILDGVLNFTLKDIDVKSNKFTGDVNLVQVISEEFTQVDQITVRNLNVTNTTNEMMRTFSFLTVTGSWLRSFDIRDVQASNSTIYGKLLRFENLREEKSNNTFFFEKIQIYNCSSRDFGLIYFQAKSLEKDPLPQVQYYYLKMEQLIVMNNNFTGLYIQDWNDQTSFIDIQNAKIYIEGSIIAYNTFDHYHMILLQKQYSSIFMMSCSIDSNTFSQANFIKTKFDALPQTLQTAICQPKAGIISPFYRFAFINFVNFTQLTLKDTALMSLNMPYLNVAFNRFEGVIIDHARILEAGDYDPATCGMKDFTFKRNEAIEEQVLEEVDERFWALFDGDLATQLFNPLQIIYSSTINYNDFRSINLTTGNLVTLKKYDFQQGSISFMFNNITGLICYDSAVNLVESIGSIHALGFVENNLTLTLNLNSFLKFSEFKDNRMLIILRNHVSAFAGYSCFIISGATLTTTKIVSNKIERSRFFHSIFDIDISQNNALQTWYDNQVNDNILDAKDRSLIDIEDSEGKSMLPVNPMKISKSVSSMLLVNIERNEGAIYFHNNDMIGNQIQVADESLYAKLSYLLVTIEASKSRKEFVMNKFRFINNTYHNVKNFTFHKELNGLFSLLIGNSKCIISNSEFKNVKIDSQGNGLFFIAANETSMMNNEYANITMYKDNAILDLMSIHVSIHSNTFTDIKLAGVGIFMLNPTSPTEGKLYINPVYFYQNTFKNCKVAGASIAVEMGNILNIKDMHVALWVNKNTIIDSFDQNPAVYFSNSLCQTCLFDENSFEITSASAEENRFYEIYESKGTYHIGDNRISYSWLDHDHSDLFFVAKKSPLAEITIKNLKQTKENPRSSLRLAQIDSGILKIDDVEIKDTIYTKDQFIVQVLGDEMNLYQAAILITNMTLQNLTFVPSEGVSEENTGVIDWKSLASDKDHYWYFVMQKCKFKDILGNSAVVVRAPKMDTFMVLESSFVNLKSKQGSALNLLTTGANLSQIIVTNCEFIDNIASQAGGAIFMNRANYTIEQNNFTNNHAKSLGGAVYISSQESSFNLKNCYTNNTASVGNNVVSSIKGLKLEFTADESNGLRIEEHPGEGFETKFIVRNASTRAIISTALNVSFYDYNGFPTLDLNDQDNSYVSLYFGNNKMNQKKLTSVACSEIGCYFDQLNVILSGEKDEVINVQVEYSSASKSGIKSTWETSFDIELRACVSGEHFNNVTLTCDYCPPGTYSMVPSSPCQDCPINATCKGGFSFEAKSGYWKASSDTIPTPGSLIECRKDGIIRCEGGLENDGCAVGFTGAKCETCDFKNGFVQSGPFNCRKCQDPWRKLTLMGIGFLFYLIYKAVCIRKLYSSNETQGDDEKKLYEASEKKYYVRLLMVYTQILSLLFLFNMEMKGKLSSFLQIGNPSEFLQVNLQCSMLALGINSDNFIYDSTLIILASPFVQIFVIILLMKIFVRGLKMSGLIWSTIVFIFLLEQPGIVGNLTSFLSCSGDHMTLYPNWSCQDPKYLFYKKLIVTPALIFWAGILPGFVLLSLFFRRNKLEQVSVRGTWGVFYDFNNKRNHYWSVFVMMFTLSVSYITYNFQADPKACAFTLFLLLCSYQFLTRLVQPYKYPSFNFVEGLAFNLLMITVILGYYTLDNNQPTLKNIAYGVIGGLNSLMFVFLVLKVSDIAGKRRLNNVIGRLKRVFAGERKDDDEDGLKEKLLLSEEGDYLSRNQSVAFDEIKDKKMAFYMGTRNNDDVVL